MLSRREVLSGGMVGSLAAGPAVIEEQNADKEGQRDIQRAVQGVGRSLDQAFNTLTLSVGTVGTLRRAFEIFLRSNTHFPEFCDIGTAVFYDVYDWHIRNRQQIIVVRQPDNRYTIQFMFTTLVLRQENESNFIGIPYDKA